MIYNLAYNRISKPSILRASILILTLARFLCNADEIAPDISIDSQKTNQNSNDMENATLYNFSHPSDQNKYYVPIYADQKARQVGDIVTIIICESSKASKSSTTNTSEKSGANGSLSEFFGLTNLPLKMGAEGTSGYAGSGTTTRSGSMEARMSATIKQFLPNGNLILEVTRQVTVNDDIQEIILSGIVRPQDISSDNTILSTYLADAKIKYTGKGPAYQQPGIITRIIQTPFHWISAIFRKIF